MNSIFRPNGHGTHLGPVFPAANWGDIIPPFEHEGGFYPGLLLTVLGLTVLTNRESMGRVGLFGPVPADATSLAWSHTTGQAAEPAVPVAATSHRGRWTMLAAAVRGRRTKR